MSLAGPEIVLVLPVVVWIALAAAAPTERQVARFAEVYEVPLTAETSGLLRSYVWWGRGSRVAGTATAAAAVAVVSAVTGRNLFDWQTTVAIGYPLGAAVGEMVRPHPHRTGRRRASLDRRTVRQYARPWLLATVASVSALGLALTAALWLRSDAVPAGWNGADVEVFGLAGATTDRITVSLVALGSATAVALITALAVRVVRTSQPPATRAVEAVEHAVRSAAVVSLMGSALMIAAMGTSLALARLLVIAPDLPDPIRTPLRLVQLAIGVLSLAGLLLSLRSIPRFLPFRPQPLATAVPSS